MGIRAKSARMVVAEVEFTANDRGAGDSFGSSVGISADYAIVGAYNDDVRTVELANDRRRRAVHLGPPGQEAMTDYRHLRACSDEELAGVDPLVMNLLVAKSIPALAALDIPRYQRQANRWADDIRSRLPAAEVQFWQAPSNWKNDVNFFRLGVVCGYLEYEARIAYQEDQRDGRPVFYTDPSDLFLNGVIDTRRGTCANMAALHVAIGWRLGWPVSLACVKSHLICRYDDGQVTHNIEATQAGHGGFESDPDEYLIAKYSLPPIAISSGSDLRALRPKEMLGTMAPSAALARPTTTWAACGWLPATATPRARRSSIR